ncbi:STY0301 family protein [Acidovorax sp. Leaf78]|uniref:STY0301 family protein n=1 Tax=unclassified Acidovorax TaxID=2684926 RepID=UPI000A5B1139|nr:STY0301 family protein [Acidovorax sp. Leaf78]
MMTYKKIFAITFLVWGGLGCVWAQTPVASATSSAAGQCPESLQVQQTPADKVGPDWQVRASNESHPHFNVSFFSGPPEKLEKLAPDSQQRKGKTLISQWNFAESPQAYWVACEYFRTSAIAARPLDKDTTGCTAEHNLNTSPPTVKRWTCQRTARR